MASPEAKKKYIPRAGVLTFLKSETCRQWLKRLPNSLAVFASLLAFGYIAFLATRIAPPGQSEQTGQERGRRGAEPAAGEVLREPEPTSVPALVSAPVAVSITADAATTAEEIIPVYRQALELVVLNGSGGRGTATRVMQELENLGYRVKRIGDAESYYYQNTVVFYPYEHVILAQLVQESLRQLGYQAVLEEALAPTDVITVVIGRL